MGALKFEGKITQIQRKDTEKLKKLDDVNSTETEEGSITMRDEDNAVTVKGPVDILDDWTVGEEVIFEVKSANKKLA